MDRLVRSNIIYISANESVIVNLTIPSLPGNVNILSGSICNKCTRRYMSGIIVTLQKMDEDIYFNTISNKYGEYLFFNMPLGIYMIKFSINHMNLCYDYVKIGYRMNYWYNTFICS